MNDRQPDKPAQKLKQEDLPLTVEDVSAVDQMETQRMLGGLVVAMGLIPLFYGAYLMFFGPDHIMVNRFSGPTFWETVRLNPGGIATIGFCIVAAGRLLRGSAVKKVTSYINEHFLLVNRFGKRSEDARLIGQPTEEGHLVLQYQSLNSSDNAKKQTDSRGDT